MTPLIRLAGGNIELTSEGGALVATFAPNASKTPCSMVSARLVTIKADLPDAYRLNPKPLIRAMGSSKIERVEVAPSATKTARLLFSGPDWSITLPADVEPPLPPMPEPAFSLDLKTADLLALVKACGPCTSDFRNGLNGLHVELEDHVLAVVATNGAQLRRLTRPAEGSWSMPARDNIVPVQPLQALLSMCGPTVRIGYSPGAKRPAREDGKDTGHDPGWIHLTSSTLTASFHTPGGEFPNWKAVIAPRTVPTRVEVDAAVLRKVLSRFWSYIDFTATTDRLTLSSADGDDLSVTLPAVLVGVPGWCRYHLSVMRTALAGHKRVILDIVPDLNHGMICPLIDGAPGPWTEIVMPVRKD